MSICGLQTNWKWPFNKKKKSWWSLRCPGGSEMTNVLLYSLGWRMSNMMACGKMIPHIRRWSAALLFVSALDKCDHFSKCHLFFFIFVALLGREHCHRGSAKPQQSSLDRRTLRVHKESGGTWRWLKFRIAAEEESAKKANKKANGAKGVSFLVTRFHMVEALFKRPITL